MSQNKGKIKFRIYADGNVVHEDEFPEYDNSFPYYDDYAEYETDEDDNIYIYAELIKLSEG